MLTSPEPEPPERRRVLAAIVTGPAGDAIQAWREVHDPQQAHRLPPHATLCYGLPSEPAEIIDAQIRHAFLQPVSVRLGGVHEFNNRDGTFYVEVGDTDQLNAARQRLYDGHFLTLPGRFDFTWHVTCVRYPKNTEREALRTAARELEASIANHPVWTIDTVASLELQDGIYFPFTTWTL